MDKRKDCKIPKYGKLPNLAEMPLVVGAKQLKKAVKAGRVRYVFLAELCAAHHIQITWVPSMTELGRSCGIEVGAAAAAVVDP